MGGILHFKEESEWEAVREKQVLSLVSSRRQDHDNLEAILKLSYDNLPCELKRCFVYCSLFPKDHKFNVKMLVRLWMVQGYCIDINKSSSTRPSHPEDIGIGFFNHLLWRSLFQEVERDAKGNIEFCKMHDLLHDLAIRMAGEDAVMWRRQISLIASLVVAVSILKGSATYQLIVMVGPEMHCNFLLTWQRQRNYGHFSS